MSNDRHIHFAEKFKENQKILPSRTSTNEILRRYLSIFDRRLLKYVNEEFPSIDRATWTSKSNEIRLHHKDDVELRHLRRIQIVFENLHFDREQIDREDLSMIIDAFDHFLEHRFQSNFLRQCQIETKTNPFEMTLNVSNMEIFHRILSLFNRLCHLSSTHFDSFELGEIFTHLFPNLCHSSCRHFFPFFIVHYHRIDFHRFISSSSFNDLRTVLSIVVDRSDLIVLDVLMKFIENASMVPKFSIIEDESAKRLLATLFSQIHRSNRCEIPVEYDLQQSVHAFRILLMKIFPYSSLKMISEIDDHDRYIDLKIERKVFHFVWIFFEHLHRISRRCSNDDDRMAMIDYFSPILFGESMEKKRSTKIKEIFREFLENFSQIVRDVTPMNFIESFSSE